MYTPPRITFNILSAPPGIQGQSISFLDIQITSSTNPVYPGLGIFDAWCLDQTLPIGVNSYFGDVYSSTELGILSAAMPTLGFPSPGLSTPGLSNLDSVNWLLNNPTPVVGTTWREYQAAIWTLMGSDPALSTSISGYNVSITNAIVNAALTTGNNFHLGNGVGPGSDLVGDVMNGVVFDYGRRYNVSELNLAMLKDMGVGVLDDPLRMHYLSATAVPEPETWALWLGGLALLGSLSRRRLAR